MRAHSDVVPASIFPAMEPIRLLAGRPVLCVIVDAEEEFHWGRPVSIRNNATSSIRHQHRAHEIFACYNVRPTYLVTYPIASDTSAAGVLRDFLADGRCDIGAQLHPWVTPPFDAGIDERLSFPGNLPPALEREKLHRLTAAVQDAFNLQPTVYKAGRYGLGPATANLLEQAGFLVDTSLIPRTCYANVGGPDFSEFDYGPFWFGTHRRLLELPVTRALSGRFAITRPDLYEKTERQPFRRIRAAGLLARTGLLERITLSPEGSDLQAMLRLTRALLKRGERIFTFSYHSPSLEPGNTPYVRSHYDLAVFLDRISGFLSFFRDELGGVFLTVKELHDQLCDGTLAHDVAPPRTTVQPLVQGNNRCLVVANTFPPVHGGSAIVYDSLARFAAGRVTVLAPQQDYRDGCPILGWREFDRQSPFPIHRVRLLRTLFLPENAGWISRILGMVADLQIRLSMLRTVRRVIRNEQITVLCIGELVAGGWLTLACRYLFHLKSIIYIHGEEISTRTRYDVGGQRRRRALKCADGIVAVSRFTRNTLIQDFNVPAEKIELVSNGVDLERFFPRPRPQDLITRYGLGGKRVLLTVSRLYARKGMDRVIECLPKVLIQIPDLIYLIVGEGTYRPALQALVERLDLARHVVFTGAVPGRDLTDYYSLGDVFIMPNREMPDGETEGFGLVFLEANACGLPVIAGRAGGSIDAVSDQINGLVVDGGKTDDITSAIIRIFQDDTLREQLRQGGTRIARTSSWDQRVEQFLRFCDRLTAKA
jgi:phosphatidyl-myo-inositol dimannoside synthase